jgi:hypothetical protein
MFQCFSAGPKQSASAWPQRAQVHQNLKSETSKIGAPNVFPLFQCFSAWPKQCGGPKSPRSLEKCQTSKFKNLDTKERSPKPVFLFPVSARDPNSAGPQRVQNPQRAQVPTKFKKRGPKKWGPKRFSFPRLSVSARGSNNAPVRGPKEPKSPKFKKRDPKRFSSLFHRVAPKSPRTPERRQTSTFKNLDPKERGPKRFFFVCCFSAGSQRVQGPLKRSPKIKKREAPKF